MVEAKVYNPTVPKLEQEALIFLDDGSQKTYIDEELSQQLELETIEEKEIKVTGLNQTPLGQFVKPIVEFGVRAGKFDILLKGSTLPSILGRTRIFLKKDVNDEALRKTKLEITEKVGKPQILIGNDYYNRTIPCLELHAAMLGTKYAKFVREQLEKEYPIERIILWTDAIDVIDYALSEKKQDRFIKNRVNKIRDYEIRHVDGENNPADIASRGAMPEELASHTLWWKGPTFLRQPEPKWPEPKRSYDPLAKREPKEENPLYEMSLAVKQNYPPEAQENCLIDFTRFSNWNRLVNCMAYVLRAKEAFKKQGRQPASALVRREEKREIESLT
uniref:Peptidase aspartic putative domain-containing protein n=1 Tax=Meloidogyne javanica TaxID=6303 RepID=A0A915LNX2_MELJA